MATQCIAGECIFGSQLFVHVLAGISYRHMLSFMLPCSICAHACICYGVMLLYNNTMQSSFVGVELDKLESWTAYFSCMLLISVVLLHLCAQYTAKAAEGLAFSMAGCTASYISKHTFGSLSSV